MMHLRTFLLIVVIYHFFIAGPVSAMVGCSAPQQHTTASIPTTHSTTMTSNVEVSVDPRLGNDALCAHSMLLALMPPSTNAPRDDVASPSPCQSVAQAIKVAPPGATVLLSPATYACIPGGHTVSKPLIIRAGNITTFDRLEGATEVVFDCRSKPKHRAFHWVTTYAHLEDVVLRNGGGDGAGCALITMETDFDLRCQHIFRNVRFERCVSNSRHNNNNSSLISAGAMKVEYKSRSYRPILIEDTTFVGNTVKAPVTTAKSGMAIPLDSTPSVSSGAALFHRTSQPSDSFLPSAKQQSDHNLLNDDCRKIHIVHKSDVLFAQLQGTYFREDKSRLTQQGGPWCLLFCEPTQAWVFAGCLEYDANNGKENPLYDSCAALVTSRSPFNLTTPQPTSLDDVDFWWYRTTSMAKEWFPLYHPFAMSCEDALDAYPLLQFPEYSHTVVRGYWERSNSSTWSSRPIFLQSPSNDPATAADSYKIQYCSSLKEWSISRVAYTNKTDDPGTGCERSISSQVSYNSHPSYLSGMWQMWETAPSSRWKLLNESFAARSFHPLRDSCRVLQATINSVFSALEGIYVRVDDGSVRTYGDRPVYKAVSNLVGQEYYILYCQVLQEWIWTTLLPEDDTESAVSCGRSVTSVRTGEAFPERLNGFWSVFAHGRWFQREEDAVLSCVEGCTHVLFERGEIDVVGLYVLDSSVVATSGLPVYTREDFAFDAPQKKKDRQTFLWYCLEAQRWVVTRTDVSSYKTSNNNNNKKVIQLSDASCMSDAAYVSSPTLAQHPLEVRGTYTTQRDAELLQAVIRCAYYVSCDTVNMSNAPPISNKGIRVNGIYVMAGSVFHRPVFVQQKLGNDEDDDDDDDDTPTMFYCTPIHRWVVAPRRELYALKEYMQSGGGGDDSGEVDACSSFMASEITGVMHPAEVIFWELVLDQNRTWVTTPFLPDDDETSESKQIRVMCQTTVPPERTDDDNNNVAEDLWTYPHLSLQNVSFVNNSVAASSDRCYVSSGGLVVVGQTPPPGLNATTEIWSSEFRDNRVVMSSGSGSGSGALSFSSVAAPTPSGALLTNVSMFNNSGPTAGAISVTNTRLFLRETHLVRNSGTWSGAIHSATAPSTSRGHAGGLVSMLNSTCTGNVARVHGGCVSFGNGRDSILLWHESNATNNTVESSSQDGTFMWSSHRRAWLALRGSANRSHIDISHGRAVVSGWVSRTEDEKTNGVTLTCGREDDNNKKRIVFVPLVGMMCQLNEEVDEDVIDERGMHKHLPVGDASVAETLQKEFAPNGDSLRIIQVDPKSGSYILDDSIHMSNNNNNDDQKKSDATSADPKQTLYRENKKMSKNAGDALDFATIVVYVSLLAMFAGLGWLAVGKRFSKYFGGKAHHYGVNARKAKQTPHMNNNRKKVA
eukprot:PhM_4_TR2997/c0_g1_i1/m.14384